MKPDLSEITFIIPVSLDSTERMDSLNNILHFINDKFKTNIIIIEEDTEQKVFCIETNIDLYFLKRESNIFYRTKVINHGLKRAQTKYACIYDTDVIFEPASFVKALELLKEDNTLVYPYSGKFVDIERSYLSDGIIKERPSCVIESFGGALFVNLEKYKECGLENETIIGWGFEDFERHDRVKILGHKIARVPGTCWHIEHPRGINSSTQNPHWANNEKELYKVRGMDKEELQKYISLW